VVSTSGEGSREGDDTSEVPPPTAEISEVEASTRGTLDTVLGTRFARGSRAKRSEISWVIPLDGLQAFL
jgi:hypothetical protein